MTPSITIQYWSLRARASGLFQMLAEGGIEYEHETNPGNMNCVLYAPEDCTFTTLLPPILIDRSGETTVTLSQTIPIFQYLGEKYSFNKGIPEVKQVALQYMHDLNDLHIEMSHQAAADLKAGVDLSNLQAYLTGDRYKKHLMSINRCIQGPFYFGEDPTYVDFAVLSYLDMCEGRFLNPLKAKSGDTLELYAPKLKAIAEKLRALPSAKQSEHLLIVPPPLVLSDELVATWKEE